MKKTPPKHLPAIPPVRIASWNVDNLGITRDDGKPVPPNIRTQKINGIGWVIGHDLQAPHIVALQEMCGDIFKDGDHRVPAMETANELIESIRRNSGAEYQYAEVAPVNNQDGGAKYQNIRCGFLYRPDRVKLAAPTAKTAETTPTATIDPQEGVHLAHNPALINPTHPVFEGCRKPLVAQFEDLLTHEHYYITNLHLASNGRAKAADGTTKDWGDTVNETWTPNPIKLNLRGAQAGIVGDFLNDLQTTIHTKGLSKTHHVLCVGDLNTASNVIVNGKEIPPANTDVLDSIRNAGLTNMSATRLNDAPSRVNKSDTVKMVIDHFYVSPELESRMCKIERPQYASNTPSLSDHNPTIASFAAPKREITHTAAPLPPH